MVWIFTEKMGKITAIAKGAKKSKSKFMAMTMPFCFGQYMLFKGRNLYNLTEGKIINSFQSFLKDFEKLTYASYLCELIDIALPEGEYTPVLFKDFTTALYLLNTNSFDDELLLRAFELKLLKATGYGLNLENCAICRRRIDTSKYISLNYYGGICEECPREHFMNISKPAYNTLRFLMQTPLDKIYKLNASKDIKKEIYQLLSYIISSNYARRPKSLEMLNIIKE
ncbi:DNA replication and repair protein RecO [Clostridium amylolyticum]|uniref:DNA repair protein RecO n=1 Tax=Clostridium amylolyticum TaxID=1121298 RepID=A0A1M6CPZ9_9CLOT|nr:DNA replication and repair protein RecO [Clostridium amylolyticum]